jgi:adenosine deaminase
VNELHAGYWRNPKDLADIQNASLFSSFCSEEHKSAIIDSGKEEVMKEVFPTKLTDC